MSRLLLLLLVWSPIAAFARLGETEAEMTARFGQPTLRSKHTHVTQGKSWELGPVLFFKQDDWRIQADLVDGRCVAIHYSKSGDWTEDQIQLVVGSNSQGAKWTEITKPQLSKMKREWKRADGATAEWMRNGMKLVSPAYQRAKDVVEAKAKAEASRKPKI